MPVIELSTMIYAPRERVFDLARSIDAHQDSAVGTEERAVAGVTEGLIGMGDEVTWEARHFGVRQRLSVRVTAFDRPNHFQDAMISGAFSSMVHDHWFEEHSEGTLMRDRFEFVSPFGVFGKIADWLFLTSYMRRFIIRRNAVLEQLAESEDWSRYVVPALRENVRYLQLEAGSNPPDISALKPFRTVVVIDEKPTSEWQVQISEWLVRSGCLYMMAWGKDCGSWDDSVDIAVLEAYDFGDIPDDRFVMTTWHEEEPLREVFWFSKNVASHPTVELTNTVILHISPNNLETELLAHYVAA